MSLCKVSLVILLACIAALGTVPYAYRFSHIAILGIVLAAFSLISNTGVGVYSLLKIDWKKPIINPIYLLAFSLLSAIPSGFMSYSAYQVILSSFLNIIFSLTIVITNTAISFTAVSNFILEMKSLYHNYTQISYAEYGVRVIGGLIGLAVTLLIYVISVNGLWKLLSIFTVIEPIKLYIVYTLSVIIWVPSAALYVNATQVVAGQIYHFFNVKNKQRKINVILNLFMILITVGAGASLAQIGIEAFNPADSIVTWTKLDATQPFINFLFIPFTFISAMSVNFFTLNNIIISIKSRKTI